MAGLMDRTSSQDAFPHILDVIDSGKEAYYEIEHLPGCPIETYDDGGVIYESYNCRVAWVVDNWSLDFLEHDDGRVGWQLLEPGSYLISSYTEYVPGEFGGTYGEEWDTGVRLVDPIPISESITMRPTWKRRQRRVYHQGPLDPPTEAELWDAIRVLEQDDNQLMAPALHLEAFNIFEEASR